MITYDRLKKISALAFPIMAGMISFNLMMLVDTGMVGQLGPEALAGVGHAAFLSAFVASCLMGIPAGVQAITARRMGEGQINRIAEGLNGGILWSLLLGVPVMIAGYLAAPQVFPLLSGDIAVVEVAIGYFQNIMLNNATFGITMTFESFFNGTSRPRVVLRTMVIIHGLNLLLDYLLIFGKFGFPQLGAAGAGLATALAGIIGALLYAAQAYSMARSQGFLQAWPHRKNMAAIMRLALPVSLQNLFTSTGMLVFFWLISLVGTLETAVAAVLLRLFDILRLPASGIGVAAATLVGHSLGAGNAKEASRWGWETALFGLVFNSTVALPLLIFPAWVLGYFFHEAEYLTAAATPLRLIGLTGAIAGAGLVLMSALLGAGDNRRVMAIATALQWGFFLPGVYLVGDWGGFGLVGIMVIQCLYGLLFTLSFAAQWRWSNWQSIRI